MTVIYADMPYSDFVTATKNLPAQQVMLFLAWDREEVDSEWRETGSQDNTDYAGAEYNHIRRIERLMAYFELTMVRLAGIL